MSRVGRGNGYETVMVFLGDGWLSLTHAHVGGEDLGTLCEWVDRLPYLPGTLGRYHLLNLQRVIPGFSSSTIISPSDPLAACGCIDVGWWIRKRRRIR